MRADYEKQLEAEIEGELKALPELTAPQTLIMRVMAAIEKRLNLPWYRQAWQMWPFALRMASLVIMLALFGALCFSAWKLSHNATVIAFIQRPLSFLSELSAIGRALVAVLNVIILSVKQLGTGLLLACFAACAIGYAMFLGLGTVYLRLALARR